MAYGGRCNCGAVTAQFNGEPIATRQCWCRQCQRAAAGGPTNNAIFKMEDVECSGPVEAWSYTADSGNVLTQSFCRQCGTPVFAQSSARPNLKTFRLGFLDDGHGFVPTVAIWTEEAPAWAIIDPEMEHVARQPAPPPAN